DFRRADVGRRLAGQGLAVDLVHRGAREAVAEARRAPRIDLDEEDVGEPGREVERIDVRAGGKAAAAAAGSPGGVERGQRGAAARAGAAGALADFVGARLCRAGGSLAGSVRRGLRLHLRLDPG